MAHSFYGGGGQSAHRDTERHYTSTHHGVSTRTTMGSQAQYVQMAYEVRLGLSGHPSPSCECVPAEKAADLECPNLGRL